MTAFLAVLLAWPRRFPQRRLSALRPVLWQTGLPVAWMSETGRRLGPIAERAIRWRWSAAGATLIENQAQLKVTQEQRQCRDGIHAMSQLS